MYKSPTYSVTKHRLLKKLPGSRHWPSAGAWINSALRHLSTFTPFALALTLCGTAAAQLNSGDSDGDSSFLEWTNIASAQNISPATAEPGDHVKHWTAPDGRTIRLVVKIPHPRDTATSVTLPPVPMGEDARPYFDAALAQVRNQQAAKLIIPKATYTFKTTGRSALGHLLLQNLSDLTIEGNGATLVFSQNQPGIYVNTSQRLKISGLTLEFSLQTSSLGKIEVRNGEKALVIDSASPVSGRDSVYYLTEFDRSTKKWVQGGQRVILPPGAATPAAYLGEQAYTSAAFKNLTPGRSFAVFHHWYGGVAVKIDGSPGPGQTEDIVLDALSIHSAPGMGILAYGMKRGLAILNSTIAPKPESPSPVSTNYDGIHVLLGGGDILIANNHISGQGDDGINLNNPVHPIVSVSGDGRTMVMSKYSRFISAGDSLAFFGNGRYLGQAQVVASPKAMGGLNYQLSLSQAVPGVNTSSVARDITLIASRFFVGGNTIERCHCHGMLVQLPNGLVQENTFRELSYNALRLLTDIGSWNEGVGAINVIVNKNTISDTGVDSSLGPMPWAAISAYGGARGGVVAAEPVNRFIDISDNTISDAQQACITVASSISVTVTNNTCNATNLRKPGQASMNVFNAKNVTLSRNRRSGPSTGPIAEQPTGNSRLKNQSAY
jgi:hypothetical protein